MPRRRHRGGFPGPEGVGGQSDRSERIQVFERTKMCKFHILGVCTKGANCRFAHDRMQLQALPDLQRTKLCKTLLSTGECNDPACRYAHTKEELRQTPEPPPGQPWAEQQQPVRVGQLQDCQQPDSVAQAADTGQNVVAPMHQAAFDSAMHTAILQMGQAAQAHAVEAARLQALAAQLQAGAVAGTPNEAPGAPTYFGSGPFAPSTAGSPLDFAALAQQLGQDGGFGGGDVAAQMARGAFLGAAMLGAGTGPAAGGATAPVRRGGRPGGGAAYVSPPSGAGEPQTLAGGQLEGGAGEGAGGRPPGGWAAAMSRVLGDEPVQINPETLRSLSSNDLQALAGEEVPAPMTPRTPQASGRPWRGPGLLGALSEDSSGPSPGLRPLGRAPEKRAQDVLLGEERWQAAAAGGQPPCEPAAPAPVERGAAQPPGPSAAEVPCSSGELACEDGSGEPGQLSGGTGEPGQFSDGTGSTGPFAGATLAAMQGHGSPGDVAAGPGGMEAAAEAVPAGGGAGGLSLAESLSANGITVKNTFLDFMPREPMTALRSVQTASGRLDLMAQE